MDAKRIIVACRCGWQGEQRQLLNYKLEDEHNYCPLCGRLFKAVPVAAPEPPGGE